MNQSAASMALNMRGKNEGALQKFEGKQQIATIGSCTLPTSLQRSVAARQLESRSTTVCFIFDNLIQQGWNFLSS